MAIITTAEFKTFKGISASTWDTLIGLLINVYCAWLYGTGRFFAGGLVLIPANVFDMLDGRVARLQGRVTRFGAFFDSVIDRYSDLIVFVGIMIYYARDTAAHSTLYVALTAGGALVGLCAGLALLVLGARRRPA